VELSEESVSDALVPVVQGEPDGDVVLVGVNGQDFDLAHPLKVGVVFEDPGNVI